MRRNLIIPEELARHLDDPEWLVVDCRFDLSRADAGREAYADGHIPGAVYAHLDRDLSGPRGPATGRHPLPDPAVLARSFGDLGIGPDVNVVACDADSGMFAARLWWLLRWLGHDSVTVLDGGIRAWREAGLPLRRATERLRPRAFVPSLRADSWIDVQDVARRARDPRWRVLDARAPARYAGEVEPIDPVAGHVPGAHNLPFEFSLDSAGRLRSPAELRRALSDALAPVAPENTIVMCGSGVTACHVLLAMAVAGFEGARLYAGSWSEWIRDPGRPIATGRAP